MTEYASYAVVGELPGLQVAVAAKEAELRAAGDAYHADKLLRAYGKLLDGLILLQNRMAVRGSEILVKHEEDTRVRPDTMGEGGPRLEDFLRAEPIPVIPGSIGIANEDLLDANVPWWTTNELGSHTQVDAGRILFGVFFGGGGGGEETKPSKDLSRQDPLFEPRAAGEYRGSGRVTHPIPERRFVRDAVLEIQAIWYAELQVLIDTYVAEVSF